MFANVKGKSQKPEEIYELIEKMMPGSKKIELFARNNNLREGWMSLGNQLGENYQSWKNILTCDSCKNSIDVGVKRYKSKIIANYDICQKCYELAFVNGGSISNEISSKVDGTMVSPSTINGHLSTNFFELKNNINEDILHNYYSCNNCHSEPIWGNRFHCCICDNFDLCEACFDKEMEKLNQKNEEEGDKEISHVVSHEFQCYEVKNNFYLGNRTCKWNEHS